MKSIFGCVRGCSGIRALFFASFAIFSLLACLLFTVLLYGHPLIAGASVEDAKPSELATTEASSPPLMPVGPVAPSGLTATTVSSSRIDLAWIDNSSDETGFKIERKTGAAGTYIQITTVGANVTSFSNISGLSPNTKYFYRVRANNASGNSVFSNETSATTLAGLPAAPSGLTATAVSSSRINLAWTDNSGDEDGFKIERKTGAGGTYVQIATVGANVTTFSNISGLSPSTEYFYRVRANNASGNSAFSNEAGATTLAGPPAAPSGLTATAVSSSRIDLAWTDNASDETGFKIERKTGAAGTYVQITTVGANVTSFSNISGLSPSTEYFYRVRAYNVIGNSTFSSEASATTLPTIPIAPSDLTATAVSSSKIDLAWTDNSNNEDGFKIERKTGAGAYTEIAMVGANVTSFSSTGLSPNTAYTFRVRANNVSGNSAYSTAASATTLRTLPAKPLNLIATAINSSQIDLAWTDNSGNEDGFKIERKTGAAGTYAEIATVGANVTNFPNTELAVGTEYFYRLRAFNNGGNSAYSNEANAMTLFNTPTAPSNLTATTVSQTQIDLAWTDNSADEDSFKIERKTGAAGTYAEIAMVDVNVSSYSDNGLNAATEYFYRVRAHNAAGNSDYSNEANATTPSGGNLALNKPITASSTDTSSAASRAVDGSATTFWRSGFVNSSSPPEWLRVELDPSSNMPISRAVVTWYQNYNAQQYEFQLSTDGTNWTTVYTNNAGTLGTQDFTFTAMLARFARLYMKKNAKSNYRVAELEVYAGSLPNAPNAPSSLTAATVSNAQIDLAWTDNADNETDFKIERKTGAAGTYAEIAMVGANVTSYSDNGLDAATEYFYRVRAHNAGGNSNYSNEANATTPLNSLAAPSSLTAAPVNQTRINLAWTDNASDEDGFKVERKPGAAGTYAAIATLAANTTAYSDTGLTANTQYFYRMRAFNTGGNSAYSNETNATTLPNPPSAPSSLTTTVMSTTQINLAWTDNASDETGFKIESKTGAAGTYAEIATVGANVTSYSNTGLIVNTTYYYRVRAYNATGNSVYSNEANATTPSGGNLALNKPITASSTDTSSAASRAVDGSATTFWRSGFVNSSSPPEWLRVELDPSSNLPIGRAVVTWYQNYNATEYEFQLSTDGTNWTTVYTNNAGTLGTQDFTFTTMMARFARLYMKKNAKSNYRVAELEIYAGSLTKGAASNVEAVTIPSTITLEQNYPNPFNPSTTIAYSLPEGKQVSLKIINIAGQEVATLADGYQDRGIYRVTFDASHLPSGVYLAVLKVGEVTQVRRIALMK